MGRARKLRQRLQIWIVKRNDEVEAGTAWPRKLTPVLWPQVTIGNVSDAQHVQRQSVGLRRGLASGTRRRKAALTQMVGQSFRHQAAHRIALRQGQRRMDNAAR